MANEEDDDRKCDSAPENREEDAWTTAAKSKKSTSAKRRHLHPAPRRHSRHIEDAVTCMIQKLLYSRNHLDHRLTFFTKDRSSSADGSFPIPAPDLVALLLSVPFASPVGTVAVFCAAVFSLLRFVAHRDEV